MDVLTQAAQDQLARIADLSVSVENDFQADTGNDFDVSEIYNNKCWFTLNLQV
jgi:hypothetical protein